MGIDKVSRKAVFLDRDGVILRSAVKDGKPFPPADMEEVEILENVRQALDLLKQAGFLLFVTTNQPDVRRGTKTRRQVEQIHEYLLHMLPLDGIYTCFHDDQDDCKCRKPKPGLILEAAGQFGVDLNQSFVIGDRWKDIAAGQVAGCTTIFIDYGYSEKRPDLPFLLARSLWDSLPLILG